jgi:hypothetical protein
MSSGNGRPLDGGGAAARASCFEVTVCCKGAATGGPPRRRFRFRAIDPMSSGDRVRWSRRGAPPWVPCFGVDGLLHEGGHIGPPLHAISIPSDRPHVQRGRAPARLRWTADASRISRRLPAGGRGEILRAAPPKRNGTVLRSRYTMSKTACFQLGNDLTIGTKMEHVNSLSQHPPGGRVQGSAGGAADRDRRNRGRKQSSPQSKPGT